MDSPTRQSPHGTALSRVIGCALLLSSVGCGNVTAGGFSEAEVFVSGDAPAVSAFATETRLGGPLPALSVQEGSFGLSDDEAEGEIDARLQLFLQSDAGDLVPLTVGEVRVRVDFQGQREEGAAQQTVPAGQYTGLRILFSDLEVEVETGLLIDGTEIVGAVEIEFEAEDLVVDVPVDLLLDDGDTTQLLVDLNSQDWLRRIDPAGQVVDASFFVAAIEVRVR